MRPLALTTMEQVLLWEHSPAHPCHILVRARLEGVPRRAEFDAALGVALRRHPLLHARLLAPAAGGTPRWVPEPGPVAPALWEDAPTGGPYPRVPAIDLTRETGFRCVIRAEASRSDCFFTFHHACCDGRGGTQLILDIFAAYAAACGEPPQRFPLPWRDPAKLPARGAWGLTPGRRLKLLAGHLLTLPAVVPLVLRRPAPLLPPAAEWAAAPAPRHEEFVLEEAACAALKRLAQTRGVMVNELLVRDFFLALTRCRRRWGVSAPRACLRVMIPCDLRSPADLDLPATNFFSPVFLDRREAALADPEKLLRGIVWEMNEIKRWRLQYLFVFGVAPFRRLGRFLVPRLRRPTCRFTASFTNVGGLTARHLPRGGRGQLETGGLRLVALHGVGPLRPGQLATLALVACGRRLCFTLHTDDRTLAPARAAELAAVFQECVRETLASAPPAEAAPAT